VSRKLNEESSFKHNITGSLAYFAPERALVETRQSSTSKSDVFSLGISALELASGEYPFKNVDSIFALFNAICLDPIPILPTAIVTDDCRKFISRW
jgi:serine/threonine protein kinase